MDRSHHIFRVRALNTNFKGARNDPLDVLLLWVSLTIAVAAKIKAQPNLTLYSGDVKD